jgi:hypothetical protein
LTGALKGIDALVSTVAGTAIDSQTILIDAAIAAGVKRFIPSEFGSCTTNPKLEKAKGEQLTWTVLACGAFLEFIFEGTMLLDFPNHKTVLFDGGNNRISCTSLPNVGKAITGILENFEATKNKVVRISEVILTQNKLLGIAETLRPDIKWETSNVQATTMLKEGLDEISAGDFSMPVIMKILKGTVGAGETYGSAYDQTDNGLLGIKELTEEDLKKIVAKNLV